MNLSSVLTFLDTKFIIEEISVIYLTKKNWDLLLLFKLYYLVFYLAQTANTYNLYLITKEQEHNKHTNVLF